MQILRDAIEIEFSKHELDPPVPTFLLDQLSDSNFTPREIHILRQYAYTKYFFIIMSLIKCFEIFR